MGYARLDDSFWISEKVDALSDKAFRLYVRSISFASAQNTDGVITKRSLRLLESDAKIAQQLVEAGAWDVSEDGEAWIIHNYTVHNSTSEERKQRATNAANRRWNKGAKPMPPASQTDANSMQPASSKHGDVAPTEQCETDASQLNSTTTHSRADTKAEQRAEQTQGMLDASALPPPSAPERDLAETVIAALPAKFRHDAGAIDECYQFARDFPGQFVDTANALAEVRRQSEAPFPRNLRKFMPGAATQPTGHIRPGVGLGASLADRKRAYGTPSFEGQVIVTGADS